MRRRIDHYEAEVTSANDYYPFGMLMPGRKWSSGSYRYGFNGKENDNEVKGEGNQQDYGMRIYDPRLGRFLSVDPISKDYPELTPYQFASNSPVWAIDLDGLEGAVESRFNANLNLLKGGHISLREYQESNYHMGAGAIAGIGFWAVVYSGGRAWPILQRIFWWGVANPHSAQGVVITIVTAVTGYEGPDIPGPGDDFGRLGRRGYESLIKKGIQSEEELGAIARNSYRAILNTIDDETKGLKTWKEKALKAFEIRSKAKEFARELSGPELKKAAENQSRRGYGKSEGPSFEELFKKYKTDKNSDDDAYEAIVNAAKKTNEEVNKKYD